MTLGARHVAQCHPRQPHICREIYVYVRPFGAVGSAPDGPGHEHTQRRHRGRSPRQSDAPPASGTGGRRCTAAYGPGFLALVAAWSAASALAASVGLAGAAIILTLLGLGQGWMARQARDAAGRARRGADTEKAVAEVIARDRPGAVAFYNPALHAGGAAAAVVVTDGGRVPGSRGPRRVAFGVPPLLRDLRRVRASFHRGLRVGVVLYRACHSVRCGLRRRPQRWA